MHIHTNDYPNFNGFGPPALKLKLTSFGPPINGWFRSLSLCLELRGWLDSAIWASATDCIDIVVRLTMDAITCFLFKKIVHYYRGISKNKILSVLEVITASRSDGGLVAAELVKENFAVFLGQESVVDE